MLYMVSNLIYFVHEQGKVRAYSSPLTPSLGQIGRNMETRVQAPLWRSLFNCNLMHANHYTGALSVIPLDFACGHLSQTLEIVTPRRSVGLGTLEDSSYQYPASPKIQRRYFTSKILTDTASAIRHLDMVKVQASPPAPPEISV